MKKFFTIAAAFLAGFAYSQNYPAYPQQNYPPQNYPNYPQQNYPQNQNNGWDDGYSDDPFAYGSYDYSQANFPDDYYYNFPGDYYPSGYYEGYYNDYRNSISQIDWNRFAAQYRLNPYQMQEIVLLNRRFPTYNSWYSYYGMNPDRWYYDRFYALQVILGPQLYIVFTNTFFRGVNPYAYFQNYRRVYYLPRYSPMPRYRNVNINVYRVDRTRFYETYRNPRYVQPGNHGGFDDSRRNPGVRTVPQNSNRIPSQRNNGGFRNSAPVPRMDGSSARRFSENGMKATPFRGEKPERSAENGSKRSGGFRS